jgi:hypothetical protein
LAKIGLLASIYVQPKTGQLVLADSNKVIGHRAYKVYYDQKEHSDAHVQLVTSLIQEHKRLAMIQHQRAYVCACSRLNNSRVNSDHKTQQRAQQNALKVGMMQNHQKHYREQNPLV